MVRLGGRLIDMGGGDSSLKSQPFLFTYICRVHTSNIYIIQNYDDTYHYLQFSSTKQTVESYVLAPVVPHGTIAPIIQAAPQPLPSPTPHVHKPT